MVIFQDAMILQRLRHKRVITYAGEAIVMLNSV
jgi:hypothetical protein